jgi:hypothetical protein
MRSSAYSLSLISIFYWPCTCFAQTEAELQSLKAMVENLMAYFYPEDSFLAAW